MKKSFLFLYILSVIISCQPDDNGPAGPVIRDVKTQANIDNKKIRAFLNNYAYNDHDFIKTADQDSVKSKGLTHDDIKLYRIIDAQTGKKIELTEEERKFTSGKALFDSEFLDSIPNIFFGGIPHTAYFLKIREGEGKLVNNIDDIFIEYKGEVFGNNFEGIQPSETVVLGGVFDDTNQQPRWLNNTTNITGFSAVTSQFKTAKPILQNIEGIEDERIKLLSQCEVFETQGSGERNTIDNSYGIGMMFLPSGLGYYNQTMPGQGQPGQNTTISEYINLIFSFTLYNTQYNDQDNDGIPNLLEDLNRNNNYADDDTDGDGIPNFNDPDDDGDSRPTINEIEITDLLDKTDSNCDGILTNDSDIIFKDSNNNGIHDYLEKEIR